jgi:hypothetical protein
MFGVRWLQSRTLNLAVDEVTKTTEKEPLQAAP